MVDRGSVRHRCLYRGDRDRSGSPGSGIEFVRVAREGLEVADAVIARTGAVSHQPFLLLTTWLPIELGFNKFNALAPRQQAAREPFLARCDNALTRHAAYYGVTRRRLLDHIGILSPSVEALDREITLGQQIMLAGYFRRQPFEIAAMSYETVRSNMRALTRPSAPQQSCQACAEKAERADAKGAIGKSWMQGWRITCRVYGARLTNEDDPQWLKSALSDFRTIGIGS